MVEANATESVSQTNRYLDLPVGASADHLLDDLRILNALSPSVGLKDSAASRMATSKGTDEPGHLLVVVGGHLRLVDTGLNGTTS